MNNSLGMISLSLSEQDCATRLFCFPYAGGSAALFSQWQKEFPDSIKVSPIELPGRGSRHNEQLCTAITSLIELLAAELSPYLNERFAFFGHSLGALIAYELAHYLRLRKNLEPRHIFISGHRAPDEPRSTQPIHELPDAEFLERLTSFGGTPAEVIQNEELMQILTPILRADFALAESYSYKGFPALSCPISVYGGTADQLVTVEKMKAWRKHTLSTFTLRMFPGDHFFIKTAKNALAQTIRTELLESIAGTE